MNHQLAVNQRIEIKANAATIWKILTLPEKVKLYFFGTEIIPDWKKGGIILFQGEYQGQSYKDKGIITEIEENQLLQYRYWSGFTGLEDIPENYSLVTYQLEKNGQATLLTLNQIGFANEMAQQHSDLAWKQVLEQIKTLSETN